MEIIYFEHLTNQEYLQGVLSLLTKCDKEFVPPLSARDSTAQVDLDVQVQEDIQPIAYFEQICMQPLFVAEESGKVVAFMSLRKNYVCEEIAKKYLPNVYVTTVIVDPQLRKQGIANRLYHELFQRFGDCELFTRTWSTNDSHMSILKSLGFSEHFRKINDRGKNVDTVYYHHISVTKVFNQ